MKVASVPFALIDKTKRLDADFYIGDQEEQRLAKAEAALVAAQRRVVNAKERIRKRDKERRKHGIKRVGP